MLLRGGCVEGIEKCRFKDGPGSGLEIILKEYRVDLKKKGFNKADKWFRVG